MSGTGDRSRWDPVKQLMVDAAPVKLGPMHTYHCFHSPRRLLYTLSYYKFAAKMIGGGRRVLDVGCGEGLGTWLLATECGSAHGTDFDADLIATAQSNWTDDNIVFACEDFLARTPSPYDAVVSFDVIEHILPDNSDAFIHGMRNHLTEYGIAIVGTPNITSSTYASAVTNAGHVNLYSSERLETQLRQHFEQVFMFGANDEVVHTGFPPLCHYLIGMGCRKRPS